MSRPWSALNRIGTNTLVAEAKLQRVLVTGAGGFLGRHLVEAVKQRWPAAVVTGVDIREIQAPVAASHTADAASVEAMREILRADAPDLVFHLAGTFSGSDRAEVIRTSFLAALSVAEAIQRECPGACLVAAGSSAEYGPVPVPAGGVEEITPCQPISSYGFGKLAATQVLEWYSHQLGLRIYVARLFQLIGRGISPALAPGAFRDQVHRLLDGKTDTIRVGNLDPVRDYVDVTDAAGALVQLAASSAPPGIYNLCSGIPISMQGLLEEVLDGAGITPPVEVDVSRSKPSDIPVMFGNNQKLFEVCGWKPVTPLADSVFGLLQR